MKADMDDMPEYLRTTGRKSNQMTWVIASLLGTGITLGMLHILSSEYMQGTGNSLAHHQRSKPIPSVEVTRAESTPEKDWDRIVEERARQDAMPNQIEKENRIKTSNKQVVFNDVNYIPRGADNVLSLSNFKNPEEQEKVSKKVRVTVIEQKPSMKDRVCWPYKEGSVERRNCKSHVGLHHRD